MFLKNREVRISLDKPAKKKPENVDEMIAQEIGVSVNNVIKGVAKDLLKPAAISIVGAVIIFKVVDAACEIAVKKTKAAE